MNNLTLKQLRAFSAVVRTKSVTKAAHQLHVTPPAITTQMRLLEENIGTPLLLRSGKSFRLTQAGVEVLAAHSRITAALAECETAIEGIQEGSRGKVTVGVVSTAKYFAPKAIAAFARLNEDVDVELFVGNRRELIEAIDDFKVDCAIMGRPPEEAGINRTIIGDHPHIAIAAPDHPLAKAKNIPLNRLLRENFLVREYGSGTRLLLETMLAESGISITEQAFGMEISSNETIKQSVMAGLGVAFISAHAVARELNDELLITLDVAGLPRIRQWFMVRQHDKRMMPAAIRFYQFMLDHGREYLPVIRGQYSI
jgi:LysR family transcriptional regulator for metE and metH